MDLACSLHDFPRAKFGFDTEHGPQWCWFQVRENTMQRRSWSLLWPKGWRISCNNCLFHTESEKEALTCPLLELAIPLLSSSCSLPRNPCILFNKARLLSWVCGSHAGKARGDSLDFLFFFPFQPQAQLISSWWRIAGILSLLSLKSAPKLGLPLDNIETPSTSP